MTPLAMQMACHAGQGEEEDSTCLVSCPSRQARQRISSCALGCGCTLFQKENQPGDAPSLADLNLQRTTALPQRPVQSQASAKGCEAFCFESMLAAGL